MGVIEEVGERHWEILRGGVEESEGVRVGVGVGLAVGVGEPLKGAEGEGKCVNMEGVGAKDNEV